jgi:hypothetical protein
LAQTKGSAANAISGDLGEELLNHWPTVFAEIVQNLVDRGQWLRRVGPGIVDDGHGRESIIVTRQRPSIPDTRLRDGVLDRLARTLRTASRY